MTSTVKGMFSKFNFKILPKNGSFMGKGAGVVLIESS